MERIAFIGGGNMASAIAGGLIGQGMEPDRITMIDPRRRTADAASVAARGGVTAEELRRRVTSPNGTTHAAIASMQKDGFADMVSCAMTACRDRAVELGRAE